MPATVKCSMTVPYPRGDVFAAWTTPDALRAWFAEHVRLGATQGASIGVPFAFWGRHTPGCPGETQATQQLTHFDAPQSFGFTWTLHDVPGEVTVRFDEKDAGTHVSIEHALTDELPMPRSREYVDDFWRFCLGNMAAHVAGGHDVYRVDFCSNDAVSIRWPHLVHAPRHNVFRALTEPALINQWLFTESAEVDARLGGRYSVGWQYTIDGRDVSGGPTTILALETDRLLELDWPDWRGDASVPVQRIRFALSDAPDATLVEFAHEGFTRATDVSDYPYGWREFLRGLARVAESLSQP